MQRHNQIVPVENLVADAADPRLPSTPSARMLLDAADVIYAVDADSCHDVLVFGKQKLARIANSDIPEGARVLRVGVRRESELFRRLLGLVKAAKGYHDFAETA